MSGLVCYSCGVSLEALSLPWSREEVCPSCARYIHCCRMCEFFDPAVAEQCREDDAEEVTKKDSANFCAYFQPAAARYAGRQSIDQERAISELDALFGDGPEDSTDSADKDDPLQDAEDLFR